MTAVTVIKAVRDRLGDSQKDRWDDVTLLLYISLCQNDICMFTHFLRKTANITLEADKYVYDLPADCVAVNRFEYLDNLLRVETRNNIDSGNAQYPLILKDNLPFNKMEFMIGESYTDLAAALTNVYGVVTSSDDELDPIYGVVTSVETNPSAVIQPIDDVLVYYTAMPELLAMVDDGEEGLVLPTETLLLPDIWFQAFLHYVCGMALQDDNDANNIQRGELEGSKYLRILAHIQKTSSKDFTSNVRTKLTTKVRRI